VTKDLNLKIINNTRTNTELLNVNKEELKIEDETNEITENINE
jgi:hypothetical protein